MIKDRSDTGKGFYALLDYITATVSWALFFIARKIYIEGIPFSNYPSFLNDKKFFWGVVLIPLLWLILYYITGTYTNIYRKSRLNEIIITLLQSVAGVIIIFFLVLIDDRVHAYSDYYIAISLLLLIHFTLTVLGRWMMLNYAKRRLVNGSHGFNTIIIGGNKRAIEVYNDIVNRSQSLGYIFTGFIDSNGNSTNGLAEFLPCLGKLDRLSSLIEEKNIEEVIVAIESFEHPRLKSIINLLVTKNVVIKIIPDMYDILSGSVKMHHIMGTAFIEIYPQLMARWEYILKRIIDIGLSMLILIVLSPAYLFIAIAVKLSSKGPVFYSQERIGLHGRPFTIHKFRSMYVDAEKNGPALSRRNDSRITPFGRFMRKWRLDELPQFYNVLKGEMSIVGPRPERSYYIEQIVQNAPDYKHLHRVQPGITSWGMVKFGYAQTTDEMIKRMQFDLIYIENMSLMLDLKILLYTIRVILQGRGK